jgi:4-alpha-glucanotransferase
VNDDKNLLALSEAARIATSYRDVFGQIHPIAPPTLRAVLKAIGIAAQSESDVRDSLHALRHPAERENIPPLLTVDVGAPIRLPVASSAYEITREDGVLQSGSAEDDGGVAVIPGIPLAGYHRLDIGGITTTIAVAPPSCCSLQDIAGLHRLWGLAAQLYSLRRSGDGGIGDFAGLENFVRSAASHGAAAVAISPVHAQFSADLERFSPYSPSSRIAFNVLHAHGEGILPADPPIDFVERARLEALPQVDWPAASRARLAYLRSIYEAFVTLPELPAQREFASFRAAGGVAVESHAIFEALHAHFFGADPTKWNWRSWPAPLRDPTSSEVAAFARAHAHEVAFHAFLQFLAERGLAAAQAAARDAGMPIGLITDLAVGTDSGGSHAWSNQQETLIGLSIGAPPDLLSRDGQDWGLAAFSPRGLIRQGFTAFLDMLRAAFRHAGGVRIDHVMGLARLWVLPEGARASEGAYLHFPLDDLLRLVALESQRHRAVVLGEDLGTLPDGFQERLISRGILGLRVMWFERDERHFWPPSSWSRHAAAMTTTHDIATVSGWWRGHDLQWRRQLNLLGDDQATWYAYENRARDRSLLWDAFKASGAAHDPQPPPEEPARAVDGAINHVGRAACDLVIIPVEDALGEAEQPNLPGTLHEHPNWRRRLARNADEILDQPPVAGRLAALDASRKL